jgi:hypothetical protein
MKYLKVIIPENEIALFSTDVCADGEEARNNEEK